jgi:WhiB family redox-sensing transcriptional regulator
MPSPSHPPHTSINVRRFQDGLANLGRIPDWVERALCRTADPELFFDHGDLVGSPSKGNLMRRQAAKQWCARCPVIMQCRESFLYEDHGVYGGLDANERKALRPLYARDHELGGATMSLGKQVYEGRQEGQSWHQLTQVYGCRKATLMALYDQYVTTEEGLEAAALAAAEHLLKQGMTNIQIARMTALSIRKVDRLRVKLGQESEFRSGTPGPGVGEMELPAPAWGDGWVIYLGRKYPATYLGESADSPAWYFMQVALPAGHTRKWVPQEVVQLTKTITHHVIHRKGVATRAPQEHPSEEHHADESAGSSAA